MIEKSGARSPELDEPSPELDELLPVLLLQAIAATVNTNANGMRNRSLFRFLPAFWPAGWLSVELPLNVSSPYFSCISSA
ncbi:MAG: hypothetical protein IH873_07675 [Chloroflexi bacterium]|nr:hypothetical protein [Chloroflexota bacterium]